MTHVSAEDSERTPENRWNARVVTRGRSNWPSLDLDLDLFIGRDGMEKLLAESFGETKKGEWSTFILGWDRAIAGGRAGSLQTHIIRPVKGRFITVPVEGAPLVTRARL